MPEPSGRPHAIVHFKDAIVTVVGQDDQVAFYVMSLGTAIAVSGARATPEEMLRLTAEVERVAGEVIRRRART